MGFAIFMLGCFLMVQLLFAFLFCRYIKATFKKKLFFIPVCLWVVGIALGMMGEAPDDISIANTETESKAALVAESSKAADGNGESKTLDTGLAEETEGQESEEEFKNSCQELSYKSLLRTPDDYIGQRIVLTAEVKQVLSGGWFDDGKYYRVQTDNDGGDWYMDDEYYMYDDRPEGSLKILKEDVIKIYAEFVGLEEIHRAVTGSAEEVPAIRAHYIELISE